MQTVYSIQELRHWIGRWHRDELTVALVPTMGALHEAHLALVDEARERADRVVVSIFVNPLQFGAGEDFDSYPRTLSEDQEKLAARGAQVLFAPEPREIYPGELSGMTRVEVPEVSDILCGAARPGHFSGVATVVAKLFNLVQPDVAVFGAKDFQQLVVIRRMARDLNYSVEIVGVPTVRESDGLAMSSRNRYLSQQERALAPLLYQTLQSVARRLGAGEEDFTALEVGAAKELRASGFEPEYVSVRRAADLQAPQPGDRELVVLAAARLGRARLIDNVSVPS